MKRAALTTSAYIAIFALAAISTVAAVDCGDLPTGKNPSPDEINRAIEELSASYGVPTEIVKGVAYQESGVQQWRADGVFVHNVTDCGLGMMQLTGSTAEQFDIDRLKTDWKYNLEAGVKTLQSKWERVLRERWKGKDVPPPEAAVLENWYYALSYYQGKRTGEYPGKVFSHIAKRPGVVAKLLAKAVPISNPEEAIPGFTYGGLYTALRGDRLVLEGKKELKVPTHVGTIGDPALAQKLDVALAAADRARDKDELRKAIRLYRAIIQAQADGAPARKAEAALAALTAKAKDGLAAAKALEEKADWAGALIAYEALEDRYLGLPEAGEAGARIEAIRSDPELKAAAARIESEKEARFLLAKAEAALARKDAVEALRALRKAAAPALATTGAGAEAANRLRLLESDPAFLAEVRERERARDVQRQVAAAEAYAANGLLDRAIGAYRRVIEAGPGSPEAATAKKRIAELEAERAAGGGQ